MTRRPWHIVALFLLSILAAGGAVYEYAGRSAAGGSILPPLVWVAIFLAASILLFMKALGLAGNGGLDAGAGKLVDALPLAVALYDSGGRLRHCNEAFRLAFPNPDHRNNFHAFATALAGAAAQPGNLAGEYEVAGGHWLRVDRREMDDGEFIVAAQDISQDVARQTDYREAGERYRQLISAAADWVWETDVLHRFSLVEAAGDDRDAADLGWMIGRSPLELTAPGDDTGALAAEACIFYMDRHKRLRDIRLSLDAGQKQTPALLGGVPRYDRNGEFLGYRGVGLWKEPAAPPEEAEARKSQPAPDTRPGRILLAEDSSTNSRLAISILKRMGYEADAVADGLKAVGAAQTGNYAAILMDIRMPEMDGFEATAAIRALPPPLDTIPIIAMTAHTGAEERQRCLDAGMDDHVGKPIDRAALATVLRRLAGPPGDPAASPADPVVPPEEARLPDEPAAVDLVDGDVLEQLRNDAGPMLVGELIVAFMDETDERLVRIGAAVGAGNLEDIAAEAHAMKSSSGTFGALPLQALSARLEAAATQGDAAAAAACHGGLPELISKTWREYAARGYRRN